MRPLMDREWLCQSWREVVRRRATLYLPPLAAGIIAVLTLLPGILSGDANVGFGGDSPPALPSIAAQAKVVPRYVGMVVAPVGMNIDHRLLAPYPWQDNLGWMLINRCVRLAGVIGCVRGHWKIGFFVVAPLIVLAPTSSFIPTADLLVEHRMYIPTAFVIAAIIVSLWQAFESSFSSSIPSLQRALAASFVVVIVLSCLTWMRSGDYQSGVRLWSESIRLSPGSARAAQNLTHAAEEDGRQGE